MFLWGSVQAHISTSLSPCRASVPVAPFTKGLLWPCYFFSVPHIVAYLRGEMLSISIISYLRSWNWKLTFSNIQTSAIRSFKAHFWNTRLMTAFMVAPVCRHRDSSVGNFRGLICHSFFWEQPPAVSAPLPFLSAQDMDSELSFLKVDASLDSSST